MRIQFGKLVLSEVGMCSVVVRSSCGALVLVGCRSQLACSAGGWDTVSCYPIDLRRELQDMLVNGCTCTLTIRPFEVQDAI